MGQESLPVKVAGSEPLKGRLERLAQMLKIGLHTYDAAREAGYPDNDNFHDNARRNAQKQQVRDRVYYLRQHDRDVWDEKRKILEGRQWLWHEADIGDFYEVVNEPIFDPSGKPVLDSEGNQAFRERERLRPISTLPRELRMCIESLTWTDSGKPNLKLYRKDDANRELRKINGIDLATSQDEAEEEHAKLDDNAFFKMLTERANELGVDLKMTFEVFGASDGD